MLRSAVVGAIVMFGGAQPSWADENKGPPTPCDKELTVDDAGAILVGKAAVNQYSMSARAHAEGCEFGVRAAGNDFAMIDFAMISEAPQFFGNILQMSPHDRKPIPNVGDEAYGFATEDSNIPDASETNVYARKGGATCIAELHRTKGPAGDQLIVPRSDGEIAERLGALCQKVFQERGSQ